MQMEDETSINFMSSQATLYRSRADIFVSNFSSLFSQLSFFLSQVKCERRRIKDYNLPSPSNPILRSEKAGWKHVICFIIALLPLPMNKKKKLSRILLSPLPPASPRPGKIN
jgi:hypothetical protein